jgi:hypothetical protein
MTNYKVVNASYDNSNQDRIRREQDVHDHDGRVTLGIASGLANEDANQSVQMSRSTWR